MKIYEERSDSLSLANILMDLLRSHLMFKMFVVRSASSDDEYNAAGTNNVINDLKHFCSNRELRKEWETFSEFHIRYITENYSLNPIVQKFLLFELKLREQAEITEQEQWEREDNEELVYDFTSRIVWNPEKTKQEEWFSLRCLLEGIAILNPHIVEEEKYVELLQENMRELHEEISAENYE